MRIAVGSMLVAFALLVALITLPIPPKDIGSSRYITTTLSHTTTQPCGGDLRCQNPDLHQSIFTTTLTRTLTIVDSTTLSENSTLVGPTCMTGGIYYGPCTTNSTTTLTQK